MLHTEGQQFFSKHFGLLCKKMFSKLFLFQDFVFFDTFKIKCFFSWLPASFCCCPKVWLVFPKEPGPHFLAQRLRHSWNSNSSPRVDKTAVEVPQSRPATVRVFIEPELEEHRFHGKGRCAARVKFAPFMMWSVLWKISCTTLGSSSPIILDLLDRGIRTFFEGGARAISKREGRGGMMEKQGLFFAFSRLQCLGPLVFFWKIMTRYFKNKKHGASLSCFYWRWKGDIAFDPKLLQY